MALKPHGPIEAPHLHRDGPLYGEPVASAPMPRLPPVQTSGTGNVHPMPLRDRARDRIMGRKSRDPLFGLDVGEVPAAGTPRGPEEPYGTSTLPIVAASRSIRRTSEEWTAMIDGGIVVSPPYDPWILCAMCEESHTLPIMINAYATNIGGFGPVVKPAFKTRDDEGQPIDPPKEAQEEAADLELFLASCNIELGLTGVLDLVDRDVESTGNGYMEVLRDALGRPAAFEHIQSFTMRLGQLSNPVLVNTPFRHPTTGELINLPRWRRFRLFVQIREQRRVWFKQYGDPRHINCQTGEIKPPHDGPWGVDRDGNSMEATEIVHRMIYSPGTPYGVPRWVGAAASVRSSRKGVELIYSWFKDAPIGAKIAMVAGGSFKTDSLTKAINQIDSMVRGHEKAWSLITLEAETDESHDPMADTRDSPPRLSLEDYTYEIPPDIYNEGGLIDRESRRVAAMFQLPPVYWGGSDDFSKAAAGVAVAFTEEQVFVPLRRLRWEVWFNHELLPSMGINYWTLGLRGANTSDDAEVLSALGPLIDGGGASPNALIQILNDLTGQDRPPIAEPWADRPLNMVLAQLQQGQDPNLPLGAQPNAPALDAEGNPIPAEPDIAPAAAVQDGAYNGPQIASALQIAQEVAAGTIPIEAATNMLRVFFSLSPEDAASLLEGIEPGSLPPVLPQETPNARVQRVAKGRRVIVNSRASAI